MTNVDSAMDNIPASWRQPLCCVTLTFMGAEPDALVRDLSDGGSIRPRQELGTPCR